MTEKYKNYSLENFITDEDFINWVKNPTDANSQIWLLFQEHFPEKSSLILQAKKEVNNLSLASKMPVSASDAPNLWKTIAPAINTKRPNLFLKYNYWVAAAATILLVLGFIFWTNSLFKTTTSLAYLANENTVKGFMIEENNSAVDKQIILPDNSTVILKPKAKLQFPKIFSENIREVILTGDAFFDIQKNPQKPFIVLANKVITKVLGTSFFIKSGTKNNEVVVAVKTGKVSVFLNKTIKNQDPEEHGIVLFPNQKVAVVFEKEQFTKSIVDIPVPIIDTKELEKFSFKNTSVSTILTALENAYGIEIVYDKEALMSCKLTTSLGNEPLFQKLDIICEAIGATYKVVDAKVVLTGKGCD